MHCGVPQGSVTSPFLCQLYVVDLPQLFQNGRVFHFAGDTAFLDITKSIQAMRQILQTSVDSFMR